MFMAITEFVNMNANVGGNLPAGCPFSMLSDFSKFMRRSVPAGLYCFPMELFFSVFIFWCSTEDGWMEVLKRRFDKNTKYYSVTI